MSATEELSLEQAYAIQDALRAELARRGQRSIGWKVGATSASGQTVMGVKEPASGFLLPAQYVSGADVPLREFTSPGVEAEVAFRVRARLAGPGVTAAAAAAAVEGALPALELPDFMFSGKPRVGDFVANSVIARAVVLGDSVTPLDGLDLAREEIVYEHNGDVVGRYTAAEVMGNPLNALAWLANHLATRGLALMPGDLVMSGSISAVVRPKAGDTVRASYTHLGAVSVRFP
ncbi:MAG TPA: fumarylacetoacetate hydrolase family protein [Methylomirabilota bacterium]|nr:fumarylacetoacetate hydrolase family protein [Methylomirabilota bacterium]